MRIELTVPALERLIGGDTELELGLRKQVVEEFAKRHLKALADETVLAAVKAETVRHVNEMVKDHFGVANLATSHLWPTMDFKLKGMIEAAVKEHAEKAVDKAVTGIIEYQKRYWGKEIGNAIDKAIRGEIAKQVEEGIRRRLEAAVQLGPNP